MRLPSAFEMYQDVYKALFSETFSCVSSPVQFAAQTAYTFEQDLQNQVRDASVILKCVSEYIYKEFSKISIECTKSQGAFYMVIGFNKFKSQISQLGIHTSIDLATHVLEKYKVAMLPGVDFGFEKEELFFRIAFVDFDGEKVMKMYQKDQEISLDFLKKHTLNIMEGVENIKTFIADLTD
jgi:aspartate/methionine/tyrosine aminotransferase